MPEVHVGVSWLSQETAFYCGPAVAQMVLQRLGAAAPSRPPSWQDRLWQIVVANTGSTRPPGAPSTIPSFPTQRCERCAGAWKCWSTTPEMLEYLLNAFQSAVQYAIATASNQRAATGLLLDAIDQQLPAVALVRGWQHWLVLDGYMFGEAGSAPVAGRPLNGIYLRDPWATESIHYISRRAWFREYMNFVPCGSFRNKIVVLAASRTQPPSPGPSGGAGGDAGGELPDPSDDVAMDLIAPDEARRAALTGVDGLRKSPRFGVALEGSEPTTSRLVQRLDRLDEFYYIVSFEAGSRETARVVIDAKTRELTEASGIDKPGAALAPFSSPAAAVERLVGRPIEQGRWKGRPIRPGTFGQHPILVWKPCRESASPFMPFYQFSSGDQLVYLRVDGLRFDELTTGPA
jgi:hypothetical protein